MATNKNPKIWSARFQKDFSNIIYCCVIFSIFASIHPAVLFTFKVIGLILQFCLVDVYFKFLFQFCYALALTTESITLYYNLGLGIL